MIRLDLLTHPLQRPPPLLRCGGAGRPAPEDVHDVLDRGHHQGGHRRRGGPGGHLRGGRGVRRLREGAGEGRGGGGDR